MKIIYKQFFLISLIEQIFIFRPAIVFRTHMFSLQKMLGLMGFSCVKF